MGGGLYIKELENTSTAIHDDKDVILVIIDFYLKY